MKKSILKLGLIALLGFTVVACGGNEESSSSQPTQQTNEPDMLTKSVADLVETPYTKHTNIVKVQGVWVPTGDANDKYGSGLLADPATGETITIYGMAPTKDAFTYNFDEEVYTYENPKAFQDLKNSFVAGDKIELGIGCYAANYKNYMSYFISKVTDKSEINYNVTKKATENGSFTVSAESGVYGAEVTVTPTPNAGYKVDTVSVNGKAIAKTGDAYKFNIGVGVNEVAVTFVDEAAQATNFTLTAENMLGYSGANIGYASADTVTTKDAIVGSETVTMKYVQTGCYGNGIQTRQKDGVNAMIRNATAFSSEIESITIVKNASWTGKGVWSICFGTAEIEAAPAEYAGTVSKDSTGDALTISCNVAGAKYFRIDHTTSGGVNVDSIIVNYKTAA